MSEFVYFLGRFHVLVLHLPIGILLLAVLMEFLARKPKFKALESSLNLVWLVGGITAVITIVLGYMHITEGGFDGPGVNLHRWSATLLALLAFIIWAWRSEAYRSYGKYWMAPSAGILALLVLTGHYGGNLTHGTTYLVEFAPGPIRSLVGVPAEMSPRPPIADVAEADIYLDVVAPALRKRCVTCHNDDKRRGELSLARYDEILKGGESGPILVAGNPGKSDVLRRVRLPADHFDYMPKNGKEPLSEQEIGALEWWIQQGAPAEGTLAQLNAPSEINQLIEGILGLEK